MSLGLNHNFPEGVTQRKWVRCFLSAVAPPVASSSTPVLAATLTSWTTWDWYTIASASLVQTISAEMSKIQRRDEPHRDVEPPNPIFEETIFIAIHKIRCINLVVECRGKSYKQRKLPTKLVQSVITGGTHDEPTTSIVCRVFRQNSWRTTAPYWLSHLSDFFHVLIWFDLGIAFIWPTYKSSLLSFDFYYPSIRIRSILLAFMFYMLIHWVVVRSGWACFGQNLSGVC